MPLKRTCPINKTCNINVPDLTFIDLKEAIKERNGLRCSIEFQSVCKNKFIILVISSAPIEPIPSFLPSSDYFSLHCIYSQSNILYVKSSNCIVGGQPAPISCELYTIYNLLVKFHYIP